MIYFTSDHHFYHTNIIKYCNRPFATVEEMNEFMVAQWNNIVKSDDIVYYLGDFSLAIRPVELFLPRLNGTKHLIMGNHDQCHPVHKARAERLKDKYFEFGFETIQLSYDLFLSDKRLHLTHMPYKDENDLRYPQYRPLNDGAWLLHGHVHDRWKIKDKQINVGVDVWDYKPVSAQQIEEIIKEVKHEI